MKKEVSFFHKRGRAPKTFNKPTKRGRSYFTRDGLVEKNNLLDVDTTSQQSTLRKLKGV